MKLRKPFPSWKLFFGLYPFVAAAVAINLFLLFLIFQAVGVTAITPMAAVLWSIPLGLPATWAAARWVQHLIAEAERTPN
ncbi:hypothetical protein [Roseovarius sp.]|uniref:hypothetical protein n=1 Tax=Roseovarius sp. TaxID=1486281 RepID=UPI003A96E936